MKEFFELLLLNIKIKIKNCLEDLRVYTRYPEFREWDRKLKSYYRFQNPFKISKVFHLNRGDEEIYVYGETPLTTWQTIVDQCKITSKDKVFDLGMGRGRGCLWLKKVLGCEVVGIEFIPEFVKNAQLVKDDFHIKGLDFRYEDMTTSDFSSGSVFYIYGNFLSDQDLKRLALKLDHLPKGTKIITVSFPFSDYSDRYKKKKSFQIPFPWGVAEAYLCTKY